MAETEADSVQEWASFLHAYANGHFAPDETPPIPSASPSRRQSEHTLNFDAPLYDSVDITPQIAERVRDYYETHHYLPPPRAPLEKLREKSILEYDLYSAAQVNNMQMATDLIQSFFGGICTFTLFRNNIQELMAVSGPPEVITAIGLKRGLRLMPETSLCGHCVLTRQEGLYISNLARDWRYTGNPYADEAKGIKSYVGSVVSLSVDPTSPTEERIVGVGVINSMHLDDFLPPLTPQRHDVINNITKMLQVQLRATWEGNDRTRQAQARRAVSEFIESTLVNPSAVAFEPRKSPITPTSPPRPVLSLPEDTVETHETYSDMTASKIRAVLGEVDCATIIDLRSLMPIKNSKGERTYAVNPDHASPLETLVWDSTAPPSNFSIGHGPETIIQFLTQHVNTHPVVTFDDRHLSRFEPFLPTPTAHVIMPFFTGNHPVFLIIVSTSREYYTFRSSEINFIRSMGVVLRAQVLQSRVIEADNAKTTFMSSISHELRTPMHGLLSSLSLIRTSLANSDLDEVATMLGIAESSGHALQQILNDVLDFGSLTQGTKAQPKLTQVNLCSAVMDMAQTCASRLNPDVSLVVEHEQRGWTCTIDEAGFQRILLNGLTNAIKFTTTGSITVSLNSFDNQRVVCRVVDTGSGIDPSFLPKIFQPFTKADSFSPGAGLGLYISKTLADRMGGSVTLSSVPQGTAFQFELPVALDEQLAQPDIMTHTIHAAQTNNVKPKTIDLPVDKAVRILVADDNEISRRVLLGMLNSVAKKIPLVSASASDGIEAVERFREFGPDLVLTDVSMPRLDGVSAAIQMRQIEKSESRARCRIYSITGLGSTDPRLKVDALRGVADLDGWLIKGQDKLPRIREIVLQVHQSLT